MCLVADSYWKCLGISIKICAECVVNKGSHRLLISEHHRKRHECEKEGYYQHLERCPACTAAHQSMLTHAGAVMRVTHNEYQRHYRRDGWGQKVEDLVVDMFRNPWATEHGLVMSSPRAFEDEILGIDLWCQDLVYDTTIPIQLTTSGYQFESKVERCVRENVVPIYLSVQTSQRIQAGETSAMRQAVDAIRYQIAEFANFFKPVFPTRASSEIKEALHVLLQN